MPWCPNCKTQYREGFTVCADCGAMLVEKLPQEPQEKIIKNEHNSYFDYNEIINPVFLITISDEIQNKIIQNLLRDADIPCYLKDKGCGTYLKVYLGSSIYGCDIYIDSSNYSKAKELVDAYLSSENDEVEYEPLKDKDFHSFFVRKTIMRIIIIIMLLPLILILFSSFAYLFKGLIN